MKLLLFYTSQKHEFMHSVRNVATQAQTNVFVCLTLLCFIYKSKVSKFYVQTFDFQVSLNTLSKAKAIILNAIMLNIYDHFNFFRVVSSCSSSMLI